MALLTYHCTDCKTMRQFLRDSLEVPPEAKCILCGKDMVRAPRMSSSRVVEVVDNGVMARRVEVPKKDLE